ncbi:MAG: GNAT family N-acetyltransferase [Lysobacteraceae bacterium]
MQRRKLEPAWEESLRLDDGRELWLRPIRPADAEPLRHGFALLHPEEIRMRFLHPMKELSPAMAESLCDIDRRSQFALVAAEPLPPGEALIGAVARCAIGDDNRAEFAILVSRLLAGNGLGKLMMQRLIGWARRKRVDTIYGDVLDENSAMLQLAASLGFNRRHQADDRGVLRVELSLTP